MEAGIELPQPEDFRIEKAALEANAVQKWLCHQLFLGVLVVDDAPVEDSTAGERNVVELIDVLLIQGLS